MESGIYFTSLKYKNIKTYKMKNITDFIRESNQHFEKKINGGKKLLDFFTGGDNNPKGYCKDMVDGSNYYESTTTYKDANDLYKDLMDPTNEWTVTYDNDSKVLTFTYGRNKAKLADIEYNDVDKFFNV